MADAPRLSLDDLVRALPNTGEIMRSVADCWWRAAYAGKSRSWPLASYYVRRVRGQQRRLALIRPKHRERLDRFEREILDPLLRACTANDAAEFTRLVARGTDLANEMHVETGHAYLRWKLPEAAPPDLEL